MMSSEDAFYPEDEDASVVDELEEEIAPTQKLTLLILLSDFFTNLGNLVEALAAFPNDVALRIQGHIKWRNGQQLDMEEAARTIEQIEGYANENRPR